LTGDAGGPSGLACSVWDWYPIDCAAGDPCAANVACDGCIADASGVCGWCEDGGGYCASGDDFGPGKVKTTGAILSTIAWLLTGHLSWFIDDRYYPDSRVFMDVAIRRPGPAAGGNAALPRPIYENRLRLMELELSFFERAAMKESLLNILLPPWVGEGSPRAAGSSLARKSVELFGRREPDQLSSRLPGLYFTAYSSFLVYSREKQEIVIISRRALSRVVVQGPNGSRRSLNLDELALSEILDAPEREQLYFQLTDRAVGIGSDNRFYRIRLAGGVWGTLRIRGILDGGGVGGPWSVHARGE
jgi:hypothetical protein